MEAREYLESVGLREADYGVNMLLDHIALHCENYAKYKLESLTKERDNLKKENDNIWKLHNDAVEQVVEVCDKQVKEIERLNKIYNNVLKVDKASLKVITSLYEREKEKVKDLDSAQRIGCIHGITNGSCSRCIGYTT